MSATLHGKIGTHRTNKILIAAEIAKFDLSFKEGDMKLVKSKEFLNKNPFGKLPVLETN